MNNTKEEEMDNTHDISDDEEEAAYVSTQHRDMKRMKLLLEHYYTLPRHHLMHMVVLNSVLHNTYECYSWHQKTKTSVYLRGGLLSMEDNIAMKVIWREYNIEYTPIIDTYDMKALLRSRLPSQLPGPAQWIGHEGGCLGLPKDVAKLILKWV